MNGALTHDPYKGMTVTYCSSIGAPTHIDVPAIKGTIDYLYSADGKKLRAEYQYNPQLSLNPLENVGNTSTAVNTSATRYFNNIIYEGKFIDGYNNYKILTENGYYEREDGKYYFYVKDHQGNIRLVVDQTGNVVQSNHYYPFGMPIGESYAQEKQPYKYNGKEFDTMHGLNLYDYHARAYDPVVQRFTSIDPLCEEYYSISPYAYCLNNPVKHVDTDGKFVSNILGFFAGAAVDYGVQVAANLATGKGWTDSFTDVKYGSILVSGVEGALTSGASTVKTLVTSVLKTGVIGTAKSIGHKAISGALKDGVAQVIDNGIEGKNLTNDLGKTMAIGAVTNQIKIKTNNKNAETTIARYDAGRATTSGQKNMVKSAKREIKTNKTVEKVIDLSVDFGKNVVNSK